MTTILAIVDDHRLTSGLEKALQSLGCTVICIGDAAVASRHYDRAHPDVVLVALAHPHGWDLLRRFAQRRQVPVVVLAADGEDAISALEQGADDAIYAPYDLREVKARVRARLRQTTQTGISASEESLDYVRCGPVLIDLPRYYATLYNTPLDLSPLEFDLLVLFARSPEQMLSKQDIFERVWRTQYVEGDRSVDSAMLRLRRKLGDFGDALETIRGKGYRLHWKSQTNEAWRTA
jgi:DNA-binding response OmpR family regulator